MSLKQFCYSVPPGLTAVLLLALAVLSVCRTRATLTHRLLALLCLLGSLLYVDIVISFNVRSAEVALFSNRIGHTFYPFLVPLFIHFFHAYLKMSKRRWLLWMAYVGAATLAVCARGDWLIASTRRFDFGYFGQAGILYPIMTVGSFLATAYNLSLIYRAIVDAQEPVAKNKLKYVFIGFGTLGILSSLNMLPMFGYAIYPAGAFGFIPMAIFAAGIFKYDLLDMNVLIRKSVLYSTTMALLTAFYAVVVIGVQFLFTEYYLTDSFIFPVALFVLITLLFGPLKTAMQTVIEGLFAKGRYDYQQTIKQASRTIASILDYRSITRLMQETLIQGMRVQHCALFVLTAEADRYVALAEAGHTLDDAAAPFLTRDAKLPQYLLQRDAPLKRQQLLNDGADGETSAVLTEMQWLNGEIALPMVFKNRLNGFLVMGTKQSGDLYTREDVDLLETLCHQSAVAIENARAYHTLAGLNRDLEAKVAERTRDLQNALTEKERTQEQLIRSESLAALGQLVAGVAHELNNPLASVTSLLQSTVEDLRMWDAQAPPDAYLIDDLQFADKELARAKSIVASLLGLARQTQTYQEQVDLNEVVRDALRVLHNQYKHASLSIVERLRHDLPVVTGNFANLGQVAMNIIKNAVEAVADREGRIVLSTDFLESDQRVVFVCRDNGPGIDPALRQDVFKPFFTTKPVGQGTGLGLYIAHEIIRKHDGSITVESAEPGGLKLTVGLPVY
jgi:two-component system NtrC family sensor kinase